MKHNLKLVGTAVPRHDARAKAKGEQLFSEDWTMPNMLYGKVLRSKYPAAILRGIDTSKAKALPGVKAVLTAKDVPHNEDITKFGQMIEHLRQGKKVARHNWNGKNLWLLLQEPDEHSKMTHQYIYIEYPKGHSERTR